MRSSGFARPPGNVGTWRRSRGLPPAAKVGALTLLGPRVGNPKGPGGFAVALATPGVFDGSCSAPAAPSCSVQPSSSSTHLGMLGVRCLVAAGYRLPTSTLGIERMQLEEGYSVPGPLQRTFVLCRPSFAYLGWVLAGGYFLFWELAWLRARQKTQQCNRAGGRWDMRPN